MKKTELKKIIKEEVDDLDKILIKIAKENGWDKIYSNDEKLMKTAVLKYFAAGNKNIIDKLNKYYKVK